MSKPDGVLSRHQLWFTKRQPHQIFQSVKPLQWLCSRFIMVLQYTYNGVQLFAHILTFSYSAGQPQCNKSVNQESESKSISISISNQYQSIPHSQSISQSSSTSQSISISNLTNLNESISISQLCWLPNVFFNSTKQL